MKHGSWSIMIQTAKMVGSLFDLCTLPGDAAIACEYSTILLTKISMDLILTD